MIIFFKIKCFSIYKKITLLKVFNMENKKRLVEVLEHKINEMDKKIEAFHKHGISQKKVERLEILKLKYEQQLEELLIE